jgi:septum formation protein
LVQVGVGFAVIRVDVPEDVLPGEAPEVYANRVALAKARAGLAALGERPLRPVLGADTCVVLGEQILGKPRDREHALDMLAKLSGREHRVLSAVALVDGKEEKTRLSVSHVYFRDITPAEAEAYWASGEPADKAGGYAIQGRGAVFVRDLQGSFSGVMGLPLYETAELLTDFGIRLL